MTPQYDKQIVSKMAWKPEAYKGKEDLTFSLGVAHCAALEEILDSTRQLPIEAITREHCRHPALDTDLSGVMQEVLHGRGLVLMRGVPVANREQDEIERLCWILNNQFGVLLSQNCLGHRMTLVQEERLPNGEQTTRGHKSSGELAMHTDNSEIFTLLCVRPSRQGGDTQFASALTVHNEILASRPDILPILYRGFPYHRRSDQPDDHPAVTPYNVPVFCNVDGIVSINLIIGSIMAGVHASGRSLTDEEFDALDVLKEVAMRNQFEFTYEPGEMSVVNNLTIMHSRSAYVDHDEPEKRRLLIRVWLEAAQGRRPVVPEMRIYENQGGRFGCDPVPGRKHAPNAYLEMPPDVIEAIKAGQRRSTSKRAG